MSEVIRNGISTFFEQKFISLAKSISDASWSEFYRKLEYKMADHGEILIKVPGTSTQPEIYFKKALRCLHPKACKNISSTVGRTGIYTCGEDVRRTVRGLCADLCEAGIPHSTK